VETAADAVAIAGCDSRAEVVTRLTRTGPLAETTDTELTGWTADGAADPLRRADARTAVAREIVTTLAARSFAAVVTAGLARALGFAAVLPFLSLLFPGIRGGHTETQWDGGEQAGQHPTPGTSGRNRTNQMIKTIGIHQALLLTQHD
jgi:hypothetical protein